MINSDQEDPNAVYVSEVTSPIRVPNLITSYHRVQGAVIDSNDRRQKKMHNNER